MTWRPRRHLSAPEPREQSSHFRTRPCTPVRAPEASLRAVTAPLHSSPPQWGLFRAPLVCSWPQCRSSGAIEPNKVNYLGQFVTIVELSRHCQSSRTEQSIITSHQAVVVSMLGCRMSIPVRSSALRSGPGHCQCLWRWQVDRNRVSSSHLSAVECSHEECSDTNDDSLV